MKIFVYGTLMRGGRLHGVLQDQTFVREVTTEPEYSLLDLGRFPGLVPGDKAIEGELWEVDANAIRHLDRIEGVPRLYRREAVNIAGEDGPVFAYFFNVHDEDTPVYAATRWDNSRN